MVYLWGYEKVVRKEILSEMTVVGYLVDVMVVKMEVS
jgi:hypothetical protein